MLAGINDDNIDLMNSDEEEHSRADSVLSELARSKQSSHSTPKMMRARQEITQANDGCECTLF